MHNRLRAGIAIYNDGYYHAAHDAWEAHWLELDDGTDDERLLHGLIQFTAAVFHAADRNWEGATGLARSAQGYLDELPPAYRDVRLGPVRSFLETLATDPEVVERRPPQPIEHDDSVPTLDSLTFEQTAIAAVVLGEELGFDPDPIEQARTYAERDLAAGDDDSRFITLLFDFVRENEHRGIIYQRLTGHVDRRRSRESDVAGLF